jgi:hypothetical protein
MTGLLLILRANGSAELTRNGATVWASDSDEDFKAEVSSEFLTEADVEDILDYLVESDRLTDAEADECEVEEESYVEGEDEPEGEDEGPADDAEGD